MVRLTSGSRFLGSLSEDLLAHLLPDCEEVVLHRGDVVFAADDSIERIYFPLDAMISTVVVLANGSMIEVQTVGNDGFTPMGLSIGIDRTDTAGMVQIGGRALCISAESFLRHMTAPDLRQVTSTYLARTLRLVGQSTACIAFHPVQARLARWLLLVRDATEREEFPLTQEAMATMLGVHRPTVTIAIRTLEAAAMIEHRRGRIRLVDPAALSAAACECYAATSGQADRRCSIEFLSAGCSP